VNNNISKINKYDNTPSGLVNNTNKTSQSCFERDGLLTLEEVMACETENFLEYLDLCSDEVQRKPV
jgi:hypothetical protein